jgi:hypothetical protein
LNFNLAEFIFNNKVQLGFVFILKHILKLKVEIIMQDSTVLEMEKNTLVQTFETDEPELFQTIEEYVSYFSSIEPVQVNVSVHSERTNA